MTQAYLSVSRRNARNMNVGNVAVALNAAPTADVFLQIDLTTNTPTKEDVIHALMLFRFYIETNGVGSGNGQGVDLPNL